MFTGIIKILLCVFNLLCLLVGILLIAVGSVIISKLKDVNSFDKSPVDNTLPIFIIALGIVVFIISFLGCCGVYQRSSCMLCTYSIFLVALFIMQLVAGIYQVARNIDTPQLEIFKENLQKKFKKYDTDKEVRDVFDSFQITFQCCGINGPRDYKAPVNKGQLPASCCGFFDSDDICPKAKYTEGCYDKIDDLIKYLMKVSGYIALGICVVELVAALFAFCLVRSYKKEDRMRRAGES